MYNLNKLSRLIALFALFLFILNSCSEEEPAIVEPEISYELKSSISVDDMKLYLGFIGMTELSNQINYGVDVYYLEYPMEHLGKTITASGLVCVPQEEGLSFPVISFQHGTLIEKSDAPSLSASSLQTRGMSAIAGVGYVVSIPDLIGFGSSSDYFHPYFHKESNVNATLKMLEAIKQVPEGDFSGVSISDSLFLTSYSQGGWITLAALEALENNTYHLNDYTVMGTVCGAGPYDPEIVRQYVMNLEEYEQPYYMPYVLLSFQETNYNVGDMSVYFKEPYATDIPGLYNGTNSGGEINAALTRTTADFYTDAFLTNFSDSRFDELRNAFVENRVNAWTCKTPLKLAHGDNDTYVPIEASVDMYNELLDQNSSNVELLVLPNLDHSTGVVPTIEIALSFFLELRTQ